MPQQFFKKDLAKRESNTDIKIWAYDRLQTVNGVNRCLGSKTYYLMDNKAAFEFLLDRPYAALYEFLSYPGICNLYFDFDLEFNVDPETYNARKEAKGWIEANCFKLTPGEADKLAKYILKSLKIHLGLTFGDKVKDNLGDDKWTVLQACSDNKFSLHIVNPFIQFDSVVISMKTYAREFKQYLLQKAKETQQRVSVSLMAGNALDLIPYMKDQLIRTFGSSKMLKHRPLRRLKIENGQLQPITWEGKIGEGNWSSRGVIHENADTRQVAEIQWFRSLASRPIPISLPLHVKLSPYRLLLTDGDLSNLNQVKRDTANYDNQGKFFILT